MPLKVKNVKVVYSQNPQASINLMANVFVQTALLCDNNSTAIFKLRQPYFCPKEVHGKIRLPVYLRRINNDFADHYAKNIETVSTLSDAAQHREAQTLFSKPDCSHACHCWQKVDQWSLEIFAFKFASRTFAYKKLEQCRSRYISALSSSMREYLDPVVKAEPCAKNVEAIGIAANIATELSRNLRATLECFRETSLKLAIDSCHFGVKKLCFCRMTIQPDQISLQAHKRKNFLR